MATRYVKSKWSPPFFLAINELFSQFQCKVTKAANLLSCLACPRITEFYHRLEKLKHFGTIGFAQHMDPKSQYKIAKFVKL